MSRPRKSIVFKDPRDSAKTANWRYRFKIPGAPELRGSTGTNNRALAERIALRARDELIERVRLGKAAPLAQWTVTTACGAYWLGYGQHQRTAFAIKAHLQHITRCFGAETLLRDIGQEHLNDLIQRMRGTTEAESRGLTKASHPHSPLHQKFLSNATINRVLNTACRLLGWMADNKNADAPRFKAAAFHLPEVEGREVFLSAEDGADFAGAIVAHAKPIVDAAFMTGMRKGNLIGSPVYRTGPKKGLPTGKQPLLCEQIRLDDPPHITFTTKTRSAKVQRKVHTVPLIAEAVALFRALGVEHRTGPVFLFGQNDCACEYCKVYAGEPIGDIRRAFKTARRKIGRPTFRFHDQRHSAASAVLLATGNLELARDLLGHADLATTKRYAHLLNARKVDALTGALSGFAGPRESENKAGIKQGTREKKRA